VDHPRSAALPSGRNPTNLPGNLPNLAAKAHTLVDVTEVMVLCADFRAETCSLVRLSHRPGQGFIHDTQASISGSQSLLARISPHSCPQSQPHSQSTFPSLTAESCGCNRQRYRPEVSTSSSWNSESSSLFSSKPPRPAALCLHLRGVGAQVQLPFWAPAAVTSGKTDGHRPAEGAALLFSEGLGGDAENTTCFYWALLAAKAALCRLPGVQSYPQPCLLQCIIYYHHTH
jgi:hypothetical protein